MEEEKTRMIKEKEKTWEKEIRKGFSQILPLHHFCLFIRLFLDLGGGAHLLAVLF